MTANSLTLLAGATLAASLAILAIALLRGKLREFFGARTAYKFWLIVPLAAIASLLPAGFQTVSIERDSVLARQADVPLVAGTSDAAAPAANFVPVEQSIATSLFFADAAPWLFAFWFVGALAAFALQLGGSLAFRSSQPAVWR